MQSLDAHLAEIARVPVLLVASDFDGTLAPIVERPGDARPLRESIAALRELAELPGTEVALISGRALADLGALAGTGPGVHLVGSHGAEFDIGYIGDLSAERVQLRDSLVEGLGSLVAQHAGIELEAKPGGAALHYRRAAPEAAAAALGQLGGLLETLPGIERREGKAVVELSVVPTDKGTALDILRQRFGASAVFFAGDDRTDEDALLRLHGPDLGIHIGPGESAAAHAVSDCEALAHVLARLLELRREHANPAVEAPIEDHTLLSDQRSMALVAPDASIVWLAAPRLDAAATFASLLGGETAGNFAVEGPDGAAPLDQSYVGNSLVLLSRFEHFTLTDYLDASGERASEAPRRCALLRVLEGQGSVRLRFAPRHDFGRQTTRLKPVAGGLLVGDPFHGLHLLSPGVVWTIQREGQHDTAIGTAQLVGEPLVMELRFGTGAPSDRALPEPERRSGTIAHWERFAATLDLPQTAVADVLRSGLTLEALRFGAPGGTFAAAATTSLPEDPGGVRNWDYRFAWVRDAAMSAEALVRLGHLPAARGYLEWVENVVEAEGAATLLRPLYTVDGKDLFPEAEIAELRGYAGSRPVRIGNAANHQVQLDVFGPVVDLMFAMSERGERLVPKRWHLLEKIIEAVRLRWQEPDNGIWEIRDAPRHHVHSKLMCWLAVDRGLRLAAANFRPAPEHWEPLRDSIRLDLETRGMNAERGCFTAAYGRPEMDGALLMLGTTGFLQPDDPRLRATSAAVEAELRRGATVYRYLADDGLPGSEGGFHLLAFQLVEILALGGQRERALALFGDLRRTIGATGLLSEQLDPASGRALGNHPQAYSHLGLIRAALVLDGRLTPPAPHNS